MEPINCLCKSKDTSKKDKSVLSKFGGKTGQKRWMKQKLFEWRNAYLLLFG
jgi:hypothetical protein